MSVAAFQESVSVVGVTAEAARPIGVVGAVLSTGADVVTDRGAEGAETLPAASKAATVKERVPPAKRSVIGTEVLLEESSSAPLTYTR